MRAHLNLLIEAVIFRLPTPDNFLLIVLTKHLPLRMKQPCCLGALTSNLRYLVVCKYIDKQNQKFSLLQKIVHFCDKEWQSSFLFMKTFVM